MAWPKYGPTELMTPNRGRQRLASAVDLLVVHYTGASTVGGTLAWFGSPKSQVSAHHVVDRNGDCYNYLDWSVVLWHAGRSFWRGREGCNAFSVGVELVGTGDSFTSAQYGRLADIANTLKSVCPLRDLVGHEHIAPGRKPDPGKNFDWNHLKSLLIHPSEGSGPIHYI